MQLILAILYPLAVAYTVLRVYAHCALHSTPVGLSTPVVPILSLYFVSGFIFRKNDCPLSMSDTIYITGWFWYVIVGTRETIFAVIRGNKGEERAEKS